MMKGECAGYLAWTSIASRLLVRKLAFERALGTLDHRWENNIKMKYKGYGDMD
jgi:hypothetical protein